MARFQEIAGWLLSSLGVALLVCSLALVPTSAVMGQGHGGGGGHGGGENCTGCPSCSSANDCAKVPDSTTCTTLCVFCPAGKCAQ